MDHSPSLFMVMEKVSTPLTGSWEVGTLCMCSCSHNREWWASAATTCSIWWPITRQKSSDCCLWTVIHYSATHIPHLTCVWGSRTITLIPGSLLLPVLAAAKLLLLHWFRCSQLSSHSPSDVGKIFLLRRRSGSGEPAFAGPIFLRRHALFPFTRMRIRNYSRYASSCADGWGCGTEPTSQIPISCKILWEQRREEVFSSVRGLMNGHGWITMIVMIQSHVSIVHVPMKRISYRKALLPKGKNHS